MNRKHLISAAILGTLALALVLAPDALAQGFGLEAAQKGTGIPKTKQVTEVLGRILRLALGFVGTLFLLLMVYAGFLWMTARGDSKKVDQAKQLITGAIIGVIIIGSAYAITSLVLATASGDTSVLDSGEGGGESEQAPIEDRTVATGGTCIESEDCASTTEICDGGTCTSFIENP